MCTPISADQAMAGDLVFFGSPAHHVGIYIGGGMMIHAPHTGAVVGTGSVAGNSRLRPSVTGRRHAADPFVPRSSDRRIDGPARSCPARQGVVNFSAKQPMTE